MHNMEISWAFRELADLLEFEGEDFFKIRAYRRAAKVIAGLDEPVEKLYRQGRLGKVPGIGKNILAKTGELIEKGEMAKLQELRRKWPPTIPEVMALPGIGPKRARFLYEQLGVASLDGLEEAAREKKIRALKGMGVKTEQEILRSIELVRSRAGRILLPLARELAREMADCVREAPGVFQVHVAGEIRRWEEIVEEILLVAAAEEPEPVLNVLAAHRRVREVLVRERDRIRVHTWWGVPVELRVAAPGGYGAALLLATGSREHIRRLMEYARERGLAEDRAAAGPAQEERAGMFAAWAGNITLQPAGASTGKNAYWKAAISPDRHPVQNTDPLAPVPGAPLPPEEEEIYRRLGLWPVPPELREDREELEAAARGEPPRLLEVGDIKGDLHVHSDWSDGANSILQMVKRAREKGYRYLAITDHSRSLGVARGLSLERLQEQHRLIRELNESEEDFRILTGTEVDILARGGLDFPDEVLAETDVVVASVHSGFRQDRDTLTRRVLEAVENEHVDIIAHPTGRLLGEREAYDLDVERVIEAAAKHNKILEINSSPDRLDLNAHYARLARDHGVKLAINTDAHDLRRLDEMIYGVAVARRAWLGPEDVLNTMDLPDLLKLLGRK
ncbi:PHP domain-containing protein [Desulfofundulus thermobenzoicus]|uniref:PHP domain-containing protein n=1 Tax=Desulfofundulus thermobenzoicus TaxID=29376 RepID=A0A6N7IUG8_9FIRM|nr:PHP domain-containing protein [Desulfofundulus thermobenzoicus]MQL53766.1 PHP domain-containing protein [Desulfofundulus thermobenzoicus]